MEAARPWREPRTRQGGIFGRNWDTKAPTRPRPPRGMGGRIEPAEPEPPPAHSLGRVDEDVMGRSGQLVRPRSLDAGGVAGGRNWWRGWWLRFFFIVFFYIFGRLGQEKSTKIAANVQTAEKTEK